jgi:hypothetical protein
MIIRRWWITWIVAAVLLISAVPGLSQTHRIEPKNIKYLGAFRLPEAAGDVDWGYSGNAVTHYPDGDPNGPNDGFPGSLFATGNDTNLQVAEISIPAPVISKTKNVEDLPVGPNPSTLYQCVRKNIRVPGTASRGNVLSSAPRQIQNR